MTHILVVGAGSIGQRHIRNLVELGVEQINVVDSDIERALSIKKWADERDGESYTHRVRYGSNLSDAIYQKPDAAIVAVPTYLHEEIAVELLRVGIPYVFIEKPVAHNLYAANAIYDQWFEDGGFSQQVVIGYSLRFHPALQIIKELLPQVGTPLYARAEVGQYLPDWHPIEDYRNWYMAHEDKGGGALLDLSHEIDYLQYLFGAFIPICANGEVSQLSPFLEIDSDDMADFMIHFRNCVRASIHMDLLDRSYNRRLRILGTEGTISWDWSDGYIRILGKGKDKLEYVYDTNRNIQFIEEMKAFIHLVETGEMDERFCTLEDGLEVMRVVQQLKEQNGRA